MCVTRGFGKVTVCTCGYEAEDRGERGGLAVAHRIAKVVWLLLHGGVEYQEKVVAPANPRTLVRKFRRLTQELARAGLDAKSLLDQAAPATA